MIVFDEEKLRRTLAKLPAWQHVAFMACCCERMLPNYRSFNAETGFGNPGVLRNALDIVWSWIESDRTAEDMAALAEQCDQQAPDTSRFSSIYTSAALDAANATAIVLEAIAGNATEDRAVEVASLARDTVDLFVQEVDGLDPNAPDLERRILENDYMQAEMRHQAQILERLVGLTAERRTAVVELRAAYSALGGSLPRGH